MAGEVNRQAQQICLLNAVLLSTAAAVAAKPSLLFVRIRRRI